MQAPSRFTLRIDDVDAARTFLGTYGSQLLMKRADTSGYVLSISTTAAGTFNSTDASLPGELEFHMDGSDDLVVTTVTRGTTEADRGTHTDQYTAGDSYIASYDDLDYRCHTSDMRTSAITLSRELLTEVAGCVPRFHSLSPRPGDGGRWRATTRFVDDLLADPPAAGAPLVIGAAARLLAATALAVFPNTAVAEPSAGDRRDAHPETLRRAIAFIEANPDLDIGTVEIARAAHVTPRTIQLAFRRHLDMTPTGYLRQVRLQQAHQQLLDGTPDQLTVTDVALRWGFATPSRFAHQYRIAYGTTPSDTLRG